MPKAKPASDDLASPTQLAVQPAAQAAPPAQRQQGGSYAVQPDGTAQRVEHTRDADPTDPSATAQPAASQE